MKLETLTNALRHYLLSADAQDVHSVFDALEECNALAERFSGRDIWKDTLYLVSADSLDTLLNMATYDIYGKLAKPRKGIVSFSLYEDTVRTYGMDDMTRSSLMLGYDIVSDLWLSNEESGDHNPDGTFRHSTELPGESMKQYVQDLRRCLRDANDVVKTYQLVNEDVLEPKENEWLKKLIDDIGTILK